MFKNLLAGSLNLVAVLILLLIITTPFYFAKSINKIAGAKTEAPYLLVSQVEKFPQMTLSQSGNDFTVNYQKQSSKQAFLSIMIINNPTNQTKFYQIRNKNQFATLFFEDNLNQRNESITLPAGSSSTISLLSQSDDRTQSATFYIDSR